MPLMGIMCVTYGYYVCHLWVLCVPLMGIMWMLAQELRATLATNYHGTAQLTQELAPLLEDKIGRVVGGLSLLVACHLWVWYGGCWNDCVRIRLGALRAAVATMAAPTYMSALMMH